LEFNYDRDYYNIIKDLNIVKENLEKIKEGKTLMLSLKFKRYDGAADIRNNVYSAIKTLKDMKKKVIMTKQDYMSDYDDYK